MYRKIVDPVEYETKVSSYNKKLVQDFILVKRSQGVRPNTIKQYSGDIKIILTLIYRHFDNKRLIDLSKKEIFGFGTTNVPPKEEVPAVIEKREPKKVMMKIKKRPVKQEQMSLF